jgi:hypothetical protein
MYVLAWMKILSPEPHRRDLAPARPAGDRRGPWASSPVDGLSGSPGYFRSNTAS